MKVQVQQNVEILSRGSFETGNKMFLESRHTLSALLPASQYTKNMTTEAPKAVPVADKKFTIEKATEDDKEEVVQFLKTYFFKDEPLNYYLGLGECKELEDWAASSIPEGCSFKAVNTAGEIIGVFLNGILSKPKPDAVEEPFASNCTHPKFKVILSLMDHVEEKYHLFEEYPDIDRAMDGRILSVNEEYRGMGIAKKLTQRTIEYMHENNIALYHILCSSEFSARACERLGFTLTYKLPYVDYLVNGENPLLPAAPHVAAKVYIKQIDLQ